MKKQSKRVSNSHSENPLTKQNGKLSFLASKRNILLKICFRKIMQTV